MSASPEWVLGALRTSTGVDRAAVRRLVHHLEVWLPNVRARLDAGLWPGMDEPIGQRNLDELQRDVTDAYAWWADRERIALGDLWPEIALRYRSPRAFGEGRRASMVRLARLEVPACPTCARPW